MAYPVGPRHQVGAQQQPQPSISLSTRVALVALAVFSLCILPPMWNTLTAFVFVGLAFLPFSQRSIHPIRGIAYIPQENIPRAIRHPVGLVAPPQPPAPPQTYHPVSNIPSRPFVAPAQENIQRGIRHLVGIVPSPQPPAPPQIRHPVRNIPFRPFTAPAQETIQTGLRHPVGNRDGT